MKSQFVIVAAACLSAAAFAQDTSGNSDPFTMLDVDKSNSINAQEAQAHPVVTQSFANADANADGVLSREEFNAAFTVAQPPSRTPAPEPTPPQVPPQ